MRALWVLFAVCLGATAASYSQQLSPSQCSTLVREVVYNEMHDHERHGYWRYWIDHRTQSGSSREEQVETVEGPVKRLALKNGQPLDLVARGEEQERLDLLLRSPSEQARHRQEYAEDERRIGKILVLLPDAFLYEYESVENGSYKLRFRPNPDYPAHTIEARIFHAMAGEIWLSQRNKRLVRLDGQLQENVDFGFGILGRLYKGGWFRLQRAQVSATDWKTERLEIHMVGRAMLFKTLARETSETRGGFQPVPAGMNLGQGLHMLEQADSAPSQSASLSLAYHR